MRTGLTPPARPDGAQQEDSSRETVPLKAATDTEETPEIAPVDNNLSTKKVVVPMAEVEAVDDSELQEAGDLNLMQGDRDNNVNDTQAESKNLAPNDQNEGSGGDADAGPPLSLKSVVLKAQGKDEADSASFYSLYMESDFRYYLQHPWARLFIAYLVSLCNFLIYAEDPVAHSYMESNIPVIGNDFAFVFTRYPVNALSLLKVLMWLAGILVGLIVGKMVVHTLVFNKLFRLKMFTDDKGSWMTMFFVTVLSLFVMSAVYNLVLMIWGSSAEPYRITPDMGISNQIFMKAAATGTWCGDFFTAWMVTDMMLQERLYPKWAVRLRQWWNKGYRRIILFWFIVLTSSFIVIFVIATDYINWDRLNHDFLHSNELGRAFLASIILVMDIIIVMQDWDFPHFIGAFDVKLPGINHAHIHFRIPRLLKKLEYWHVHISGKWFNYGILFMVILLDLNMWKNQIFYDPLTYGQYVDTDGRIHSVVDAFSVANARTNATLISFDYRNSTFDPITGKRYIELDIVMNARYRDFTLPVKAMAFIPSILVFIMFGVFVWIYGRMPKPSKDDPYGGRLKKRKKSRFSLRIGWKRLRKRLQSPGAVLNPIEAQVLRGEERELVMKERVVEVLQKEMEEGQGDAI